MYFSQIFFLENSTFSSAELLAISRKVKHPNEFFSVQVIHNPKTESIKN